MKLPKAHLYLFPQAASQNQVNLRFTACLTLASAAGLLDVYKRQVDICSLEVISRGDNDWYYDRISEQAAEIWKGERIL